MPSAIKNSNQGGKRPGQKYKSLIVWNYLLKHTDEQHAVSSKDIIEHLNLYGITADRHSIVRDIQDILTVLEKDQALYDEFELDERETVGYAVEYDEKLHGYKVSKRPYEFANLHLLAECVRSCKFISKTQEDSLIGAIGGLCSEAQEEELQNEVYVIGRNKTSNKNVMASTLEISAAIRENRQIRFKYLKYTLQSKNEQVERRRGSFYYVSPFKLIINDANYYLLAYDSKAQDMRTYRVDRMKEAKRTDTPREGKEVFQKINMESYTRRVFSMYGGEEIPVKIRFINPLLDTVIERFGTGRDTMYSMDDSTHFTVSAKVEVSDQFYAWVCGFRKKAQIVSPPEVIEGMEKFLKDIAERYQSP